MFTLAMIVSAILIIVGLLMIIVGMEELFALFPGIAFVAV